MQVAEILSDLTSLRVCVGAGFPILKNYLISLTIRSLPQGHSQALALVNVHQNTSDASTSAPNDPNAREGKDVEDIQKPDLKRAHELVHLHYDIKAKHFQGQDWVVDEDLQRARTDVNRVLQDLKGK